MDKEEKNLDNKTFPQVEWKDSDVLVLGLQSGGYVEISFKELRETVKESIEQVLTQMNIKIEGKKNTTIYRG